MKDKRKAGEVSQVQDRITDRWIKVVTVLVGMMMTMTSTIGYLLIDRQDTFIDGQKETNAALEKIKDKFNEKFSSYAAKFENHEGRISNNTKISTDNIKRIIKLEGNK